MSAEWFYRTSNESHGPFTAAQLRQLATQGIITPPTDVRCGADAKWIAAQSVSGLFPSPPPPPVAAQGDRFSDLVNDVLSEAEPQPAAPARWVAGDDVAEVEATDRSPRYVYKMVQMAPNREIGRAESRKGKAAEYLQSIVNEYARDGWEFFRVDTIGVQRAPGCLGIFFGLDGEQSSYYVVTFRRQT